MTDQPDNDLMALLVCPVSRGPLKWSDKKDALISEKAGLVFPVRNGIPILIEEEAHPLNEA